MELKCSIMIMSHNNYELLQECVKLIKGNTDIPFELIIVDDASDVPYKKEDYDIEELTIVRMPKRSNCCNLRNVGMEMAKTDLVFWLDNDTMVGENWYKPLLEKMNSDEKIGLTGQPKDSRLIRNPFLPLTQRDCMVEYQFAYDYNHLTGECDFITSYCVLVRRQAYRPTYCYNMPTPCLDPELGAVIKANGYKVVVSDTDINVSHQGSATGRPFGRNYLFYLSRNFTRWWEFWKEKAPEIFELYKGIPVTHNHNQNEPNRNGSAMQHGDFDKDYETIPEEYKYIEP